MLYSRIDDGRVPGPNMAFLAETLPAGTVVGIRGNIGTRIDGFDYDLFAGTSIYKPSAFPNAGVTLGFRANCAILTQC